MKKEYSLTEHDFEDLLTWLSEDRETAGHLYEQTRTGLIRFFRYRGCSDPASLADETINRVAARIATFDENAKGKFINVFYGFASKVFLENVSRRNTREVQLDPSLPIEQRQAPRSDEEAGTASACLESCLGKLAPDENKLIIAYYGKEKQAGIAFRRDLAESMNMKIGTLHTRVCRIRSVLKSCIDECMQK